MLILLILYLSMELVLTFWPASRAESCNFRDVYMAAAGRHLLFLMHICQIHLAL